MKNTTNKRILYAIAAIIVVLIASVVWFASIAPHKQKMKTAVIQETPTSNSANNTITTYHADSYTISYPKDWNQNGQKLTNNEGTVVHIQPATDSGTSSNITIEVLNAQLTSIDTITRVFRTLGYTQTTNNVGGNPAQKYIGTLPTQNGNLHTIAYVFQQNEKIYYLKLEYLQPSNNEQLEIQFDQIVSSFVLH